MHRRCGKRTNVFAVGAAALLVSALATAVGVAPVRATPRDDPCAGLPTLEITNPPYGASGSRRALPPARVGVPYHFQFEVTAGYPPADVQWTVTYGLLPYGLTLSSGGLLSGTPAPSTVARSPYSFQVLAEDKKCQPYFPQAGDQFNSAPFSIAVEPNAITTRADLRVFVNAEADAYDQVGAGFRRGSKFVVKVQNRGPDNAHQVEVLFEWSADAGVRSLPAGAKPVLTFRLYRCKETGQSAICTVPSIARGHSESIEILLGFGIGASYPRGVVREVVRLRASAKADEPDPRPSNNCRQVSITVFPSKPGQPGTPEGC